MSEETDRDCPRDCSPTRDCINRILSNYWDYQSGGPNRGCAAPLGGGLLDLRVLLTGGDSELCARLQDAEPGDLQWQVLPVGLNDEPVQHGIVEQRPPRDVDSLVFF